MAASIASTVSLIRCALTGEANHRHQADGALRPWSRINAVKINGHAGSLPSTPALTATVATPEVVIKGGGGYVKIEEGMPPHDMYQNIHIPTEKQAVDPYRQGLMTDGGVGYRQTVVVRSYEVGADSTASMETLLSLLQETALNHVWMSGLLGDGFGATHGMIRNDLIWVVSRMQVQVDRYPIWGEVIVIDTWVGASGKNGMRRDWVMRSKTTQEVFARATSTWVMMNGKTRRLSKMPPEVRAEISPWFLDRRAITDDVVEKIVKLDGSATYVDDGLKPKRSDLDMNKHVNNVKYVRWMLETIPDQVLEAYQLASITLEYRRECSSSDVVQSLCQPDKEYEDGDWIGQVNGAVSRVRVLNGFNYTPADILNGGFRLLSHPHGDSREMKYTHLLRMKAEGHDGEITRGRTVWRKKLPVRSISLCIG